MIYIDKEKYSDGGVDVYPDHESKTQFWYLPGTVRLAQRNGRKLLSYLWFSKSAADANGTGFLNFEVNTAVPSQTLDGLKKKIAAARGLKVDEVRLAPVPYQSGSVNFSVLGPVAAQAPAASTDPALLYQSAEQLVWNAGSSSLVGDNAAVCSVKFSQEGMLAAAMKAALESRSQSIAAVYRLEFLAMRPSVRFTVKGTFKKTIQDFQMSIGTQLPLEALVLDLGFQAQWQKIMQNTDLKIKVEDYSGSGSADQEGLKWAQRILLDYVLKNFFEVQVGPASGAWSPLSQAPQVDEAVQKAKAVEEVATDQQDDKQDGSTPEQKDEAVKEVVKAATMFIPKVNIRASYYEGRQVNTIDFEFTESKARVMPVLPQAVIGLEKDDKPADFITTVNRAQDPFGQPYPVVVSLPAEADCAAMGLQTLNVEARYPAGAPAGKQQALQLSLVNGKAAGANPLAFQLNGQGDTDVDYRADFVFQPGGEWQGDAFEYASTGTSSKGSLTAMPELVVELLRLRVDLDEAFVWGEADQAVVGFTSDKWKGEKRVVLQKGRETTAELKLRCDAKFKASPVQYSVELRRGTASVHRYGPLPVQDGRVSVVDPFPGHVPVSFNAGFASGSATVTLSVEQGDFAWEEQFTLEAGKGRVTRSVPWPTKPKRLGEVEVRFEADLDSGESLSGTVKGGGTRLIKAA